MSWYMSFPVRHKFLNSEDGKPINYPLSKSQPGQLIRIYRVGTKRPFREAGGSNILKASMSMVKVVPSQEIGKRE